MSTYKNIAHWTFTFPEDNCDLFTKEVSVLRSLDIQPVYKGKCTRKMFDEGLR